MVSCALLSLGEAAAGAGVGWSLGLGGAIARGTGDSSAAVALAGVGFGVFSGSSSLLAFFLADDFLLPDFVLLPFFFFLLFAVAEGLFDFLAEGVGRRFPPSSSPASDFDLAAPAGDFFGFGVGDSSASSSSALGFEGVFFGAGVGLFFFFGEVLGVADAEPRCFGGGVSLGESSSLTCPCRSDPTSAKIARAVTMQRRKCATSSAP